MTAGLLEKDDAAERRTVVPMTSVRRARISALAAAVVALVVIAAIREAPAITIPTYVNHYANPPARGQNAAEPTIGVNTRNNDNTVMYLAGTETLRVTSFTVNPNRFGASLVSAPLTSVTTLDPVLFTDRDTGRTFVSQLYGACSLLAFTDNNGDGGRWEQNVLGCGAAAMVDHQSIGGGPFKAGSLFQGRGYQNATYYCASLQLSAQCALSTDGGFTFGPAVPAYSNGFCIRGHGHLRVGPDGTVYLPHHYCNARQTLLVSEDNGLTWTPRPIPNSQSQQESDPAVAIDSAGKVYVCMQGKEPIKGDGIPQVAMSADKGRNWSGPQTLPSPTGTAAIKNIQFPAIVAGAPGRAACAFLGTPTSGDDQSDEFKGVWHLYVSTTYDGGTTWMTVDATPTDPVQRGPISLGGTGSANRNLLDFIDITIDRFGRVLVAYADGCIDACRTSATAPSDAEVAVIARQSGGTLLCEPLGACT